MYLWKKRRNCTNLLQTILGFCVNNLKYFSGLFVWLGAGVCVWVSECETNEIP